MIASVWYVAFSYLFLNGVSAEVDLNRSSVQPSPSSDARQEIGKHFVPASASNAVNDVFAFACRSVCGNMGNVLECELKMDGECAKRYYVVCRGKDQCQWETVKGSCDLDASFDECERLVSDRDDSDLTLKMKRRNDPGLSYLRSVGIVPVLRRKFNTIRRRDLGEQQQPISTRTPVVMTSGNGHAYAVEGNKLVESHFGGPPVWSTLPNDGLVGFPFPFIPPIPGWLNPAFSPQPSTSPPQPTPLSRPASPIGGTMIPHVENPSPTAPKTTSSWTGFHTTPYNWYPPVAAPSYSPVYSSYAFATDGRLQANDQYNMWDRPKFYSPFTNFFNSVGLQDPMLLLQYLG